MYYFCSMHLNQDSMIWGKCLGFSFPTAFCSKENMEELHRLIVNNIIGAIHKNEELGNLSHSDALDLIDLTTKLYMKIYSKFKRWRTLQCEWSTNH